MQKFDLALSAVWEYDEDFLNLIEEKFQKAGLSTFLINEYNVHEITDLLKNKKLSFQFYLDRASDVDDNFEPIAKMLAKRNVRIINPYKLVAHAIDKASMHLEFITAGLHVPYSIIIPPHSEAENIKLTIEDLSILGRPFIIKPCNTTGGGIGVVTGAETLMEVLDERITNKNDKYLIQQKIYPKKLNGNRTWFRCFWAFGKSIPVWWDDQTHIYKVISAGDMKMFRLNKLHSVTTTVAKVCKLDYFSTEIVYTVDNKFVVVDYVNDQCDMRLQSKHFDGVPDEIVNLIIDNMLRFVKRYKQKK